MMQTIKIDAEFRDLLPELGRGTFELLEENILKNGCRDSLVLWENILIDGHNRYEICKKHDIPFTTINKDFGSREEALIWIISTQVSRRNLSPIQLAHFRGLHYAAAKSVQGVHNQYTAKSASGQNDHQQNSTAIQLSEQYKVAPKTIRRDAKVSDAIEAIGSTSPAAKKMVLSGDVNIGKQALEALSAKPKEFIADIAQQIEEGAYDKKLLDLNAPERNSAAGSVSPEPPRLQAEIKNITDSFSAELRKIVKSGSADELKTALRAFIDMLENLYSKM